MIKQYLISIRKDTLENISDEDFFRFFFESYSETNSNISHKKITLENNGIQFFDITESNACGIHIVGQNFGGCIEYLPSSCFDIFKKDFSSFTKIIAKHAAHKNNLIVSKSFDSNKFKYGFENEVLVFLIPEIDMINLFNKTISAKRHLKTKILSDYINNNKVSYPLYIGSHSYSEIGIYVTFINTGNFLCSISPKNSLYINVEKDILRKENIAIIYNEILKNIGYEFRI
jgi:hypothetical protein